MSGRKIRPRSRLSQALASVEVKVTHVRRCYVCGTVLEAESAVILKCNACGKHLAPYYYFDESRSEGVSDQGLHWSLFKEALDYNPIYGLSTYWSTARDDKENYEGIPQRNSTGSQKP